MAKNDDQSNDLQSIDKLILDFEETINQANVKRKQKKKMIKEWTKEFKVVEGREPTTEDKKGQSDLFKAFKLADQQVKRLEADYVKMVVHREKLIALQEMDMGNEVGALPSYHLPTNLEEDAVTPPLQQSASSNSTHAGEKGADLNATVGRSSSAKILQPSYKSVEEVDQILKVFEEHIARAKTKKRSCKRQIKEWIDEFEVVEGRPPTLQDKKAHGGVYQAYKYADEALHRLEVDYAQMVAHRATVDKLAARGLTVEMPSVYIPQDSQGDEADEAEETEARVPETLGSAEPDWLEKTDGRMQDEEQKTAESLVKRLEEEIALVRKKKKIAKGQIKAWTKEFKEVEGREPELADKSEQKVLFQTYKFADRALKRLEEELQKLKILIGEGDIPDLRLPKRTVNESEIQYDTNDRGDIAYPAWLEELFTMINRGHEINQEQLQLAREQRHLLLRKFKEEIAKAKQKKKTKRKAIWEWTKAFTEKYAREPSLEDKKSEQEMFKSYKISQKALERLQQGLRKAIKITEEAPFQEEISATEWGADLAIGEAEAEADIAERHKHHKSWLEDLLSLMMYNDDDAEDDEKKHIEEAGPKQYRKAKTFAVDPSELMGEFEAQIAQARNAVRDRRQAIWDWEKDFAEEHGREATLEDKANRKELFRSYLVANNALVRLQKDYQIVVNIVKEKGELTEDIIFPNAEEARQVEGQVTTEELDKDFPADKWLQDLLETIAEEDEENEQLEEAELSDLDGLKQYPKARIFAVDPEELIEKYEAAINEAQRVKRKRRNAILEWEKAFEEENGRPPSDEDRISAIKLFRDYKVADRVLKRLQKQFATVKLCIKDEKSFPDEVVSPNMESIQEEEETNETPIEEMQENFPALDWLQSLLGQMQEEKDEFTDKQSSNLTDPDSQPKTKKVYPKARTSAWDPSELMDQYEEAIQEAKRAKRKRRNAILQWEKAFEEENGRPPSDEDKISAINLFRDYKIADKVVKRLQKQFETARQCIKDETAIPDEVISPDIESIQTEEQSNEIPIEEMQEDFPALEWLQSLLGQMQHDKEDEYDGFSDTQENFGTDADFQPRTKKFYPKARTSALDPSELMDQFEEVILEAKRAKRKRRNAILQWEKEFEERNGHAPTAEDKRSAINLFRDFKIADSAVKRLQRQFAAVRLCAEEGSAIPDTIMAPDLESTFEEEEKKEASMENLQDSFPALDWLKNFLSEIENELDNEDSKLGDAVGDSSGKKVYPKARTSALDPLDLLGDYKEAIIKAENQENECKDAIADWENNFFSSEGHMPTVEDRQDNIELYEDYTVARKAVKRLKEQMDLAKDLIKDAQPLPDDLTKDISFQGVLSEERQKMSNQFNQTGPTSWLQDFLLELANEEALSERLAQSGESGIRPKQAAQTAPKSYLKAKTFPVDPSEVMNQYNKAIEQAKREKRKRRAAIVNWEKEFEALNGHSPTLEDRKDRLDLFKDYQVANQAVKRLQGKKANLELLIRDSKPIPQELTHDLEARAVINNVRKELESQFSRSASPGTSWLQDLLMEIAAEEEQEKKQLGDLKSAQSSYSQSSDMASSILSTIEQIQENLEDTAGPQPYPKAKVFAWNEEELIQRYDAVFEQATRARKKRRAAIINWEQEFKLESGRAPTVDDCAANMKLFTDYEAANNAIRRLQRQLASDKLKLKGGENLPDGIECPDLDEILEDEAENLDSFLKEVGFTPTSWLTTILKDLNIDENNRALSNDGTTSDLISALPLQVVSNIPNEETPKLLTNQLSGVSVLSNAVNGDNGESTEDLENYQRDQMRAKFMQIKQEMAEEIEQRSPPKHRESMGLDSLLFDKASKDETAGFFKDKNEKSKWKRVRRMVRSSVSSPRKSLLYAVESRQSGPDILAGHKDIFGDQGYLDIEYPPEERGDYEKDLEDQEVEAPPPTDLRDVILDLEQQVENEEIPDAVESFGKDVPTDEMVVSSIPVEEMKKREREMEEARIKVIQEESSIYMKRELDLAWREQNARNRVSDMESGILAKVEQERRHTAYRSALKERAINKQFIRTKEELTKHVKAQMAYVKEKFGELEIGEQPAARRARIIWNKVPQPVEVHVHMLRAVKDKIPKGKYVMLISMYERLGGLPLKWSRAAGPYGSGGTRPCATRPVKHGGRFYDRELRFDQSVFALCPSHQTLRPANVFIFELFQLASKRNPVDRVVGWGVLPVCDARFHVTKGRFRIPVLRGEHDEFIDKHSTIESLICQDLSNWLCNMYVEVRHLPRERFAGEGNLENEYDLEYDYINKLLRLNPMEIKAREAQKRKFALDQYGEVLDYGEGVKIDKNAAGPLQPQTGLNKQSQLTWWVKRFSIFNISKTTHEKNMKTNGYDLVPQQSTNQEQQVEEKELKVVLKVPQNGPEKSMSSRKGSSKIVPGSETVRERESDSAAPILAVEHQSPALDQETKAIETPTKRKVIESNASNVSFVFDQDTDDSEDEYVDEDPLGVAELGYSSGEEMYLSREDKTLLAGNELSTKQSGLRARRRRAEGSRWEAEGLGLGKGKAKVSKDIKDSDVAAGADLVWSKLTDPQEMEYFSMAVAADPGKDHKPLPSVIMWSKIRYIRQEVLSDLALSNWKSSEMWITLFIYLVAFWMRMYFHYLGQYLYLVGMDVPVYGFEAKVHMMTLKYVFSSVTLSTEIGLVLLGPIANLILFIFFCLVGYSITGLTGFLPDNVSKFLAAYGTATVLDPFLIFLIDLFTSNYSCTTNYPACEENYTSSECSCFEGDAWKLWVRLEKEESAGVSGGFLTLILYAIMTFGSFFFLYNYLLYVHMNGRMLDVYRRLTANSMEFFLPHDFELPLAEVNFICDKAKRWLGVKGEKRNIAVSEYELRDPLLPEFVETTTHIAIHEMDISGARTLWRHFLRTPDGAVLELFDDLSSSFGGRYRALESLIESNNSQPTASGFFAGLEAV